MFAIDKQLEANHPNHITPVFGCEQCSNRMRGVTSSPAKQAQDTISELVRVLEAFMREVGEENVIYKDLEALYARLDNLHDIADAVLSDYEEMRRNLNEG